MFLASGRFIAEIVLLGFCILLLRVGMWRLMVDFCHLRGKFVK